jgi:hypothetical protein
MIQPTLLYNKEKDLELQKKLLWPDERLSLVDEDFFDALFEKNKDFIPPATDRQSRAEFVFYLLVQVGRRRPALFPVPDICLAAFNILTARHNLAENRLVCLDLGLLPTAVLASGWGAKVASPLSSQSHSWPEHFWPENLTDDRNIEGALVLGRDPVRLTEENPGLLKDMVKAAGGLVFCYWDFLGVNLHSHERLKWLECGILRTLVQFPRPSRQGVIYYPALIETGPGFKDSSSSPSKIRLADVRVLTPGPGGLSQAEVLRVATGEADGEKSLDVTLEQLASREEADFSPRRLLAAPQGIGEALLTKHAQVIRCQLPRTKPSLDKDENSYYCREISLSHLDDLTGFVKPAAGQPVKFKGFNPEAKEGKYLLQLHDILICFRGTEATIGRVGLVAERPKGHMVNGQSLCLIRAFKGFDPLWLYYYLRQDKVRLRILSRSSGSSMLTVNLEDLRRLTITQPGPTQSALVLQRHQILLGHLAEIRQHYGLVSAELKALGELVS